VTGDERGQIVSVQRRFCPSLVRYESAEPQSHAFRLLHILSQVLLRPLLHSKRIHAILCVER
jgi:hypothetical protein